jgi:hypothetical protein
MLFFKFGDLNVFKKKQFGTSPIFDVFFILVYLLSISPLPKISKAIGL